MLFTIIIFMMFLIVKVDSNNPNYKGLITEFMFGKDRELFHISFDLKWCYHRMKDSQTWSNLIRNIKQLVARLYSGDEFALLKYKERAITLLLDIRKFNRDSKLRIFKNSFQQAYLLSTLIKKNIVMYIENEDSTARQPSIEAITCRISLSSSSVTHCLNDQYIFMGTYQHHPYAKETVKFIKNKKDAIMSTQSNSGKINFKYPIFVVLQPRTSNLGSNKIDFDVVEVVETTDRSNVSPLSLLNVLKNAMPSNAMPSNESTVIEDNMIETNSDHVIEGDTMAEEAATVEL